MNKFYVQSGSLKEVLVAREPLEACLRALDRSFDEDLSLSPCFVVSQRGFVLDREPTEISTNEQIYSSQDVIEEYMRTHTDKEEGQNENFH